MKAPIPSLAAAAMLFVGIFVVIAGASVAWADAPTHEETVLNESVTADHGTTVQVDPASDVAWSGALDNETVRDSTGSELDEGTDYEWNPENGTVTFLSSGSTADGESATVSYTWLSKSENAVNWYGPIAALVNVLPIFALVAGGIGVAGLLYWGVGTLTSVSGRGGRY